MSAQAGAGSGRAAERPVSGARIPGRSYGIVDVIDEVALYDYVVWNAPDHEYTRRTLRERMEELVDEALDLYETLGGDAAQGLPQATVSPPKSVSDGAGTDTRARQTDG